MAVRFGAATKLAASSLHHCERGKLIEVMIGEWWTPVLVETRDSPAKFVCLGYTGLGVRRTERGNWLSPET